MKFLRILLVLFFTSCASNFVMVDYKDNVDFTKYKTFNFYEDLGKDLNQFDKNRIKNAIISSLETKGLEISDNPDFLINVLVNFSEVESSNVNIGFGSGGRNGGFGISGGIPLASNKLNEEFILELVDSKTDSLFWEGILNTKIDKERKPDIKEVHYNKVIEEILKKYPIKKTSKN